MEKKKLKEILKRYTKSLVGASGETIITNYGKMRDFVEHLDEDELGEELCCLCERFPVHQALKAIEKEKVSLKSCSTDWNAKSVAKGYQLAKECNQIYKERGLNKEYEEKLRALCIIAKKESSLATQLCLLGLFFNGEAMTAEELARLKELLSDEPLPKK